MGLRYLPVFTGGTLIHEYLRQDQDVIRAGLSMLWMAVLGAILLWSATPIESHHPTQRRQVPPYQISPKPCWVDGVEGTCMFVLQCINSEGYAIGMCVDGFMFGSCCAHNNTENAVLPHQDHHKNQPSVLYTPPSQHGGQRPIPKPSSRPYHSSTKKRPSSSSQVTFRPHVISTSLNLRTNVSSPKHPTQPPRHSSRPMSTDTLVAANSIHVEWQASTEPGFITSMKGEDKQSGVQWQITTEPGFVTKFKVKPSSSKPKPTKKPLPGGGGKNSTKYGSKVSRPTVVPVTTTTARVPSSTMRNSIVDLLPNVVANATVVTPDTNSSVSPVPTSEAKVCGTPAMHHRPQTRIVGGKDASFGRWPWQVSVRRTSFFGFSSTHRCGGAVLNENWIATAGHCVDDLLTSQIRIRVGEYDFSNAQEELPYVERAVAKKIVHPKYNFFTYEYDLALVQLDKALEFAPHISPICLPASDDLLIGENATVTGWGRLSEGGTLPTVLQEVQVPIVSNDRCKSMFLRAGRHEHIPDIFLCAGHETGGQDSCQGDSGGPLQVRGKDGRYFLAGIISWGIGCAEANLPGVCTRISKFVPWILKNVT